MGYVKRRSYVLRDFFSSCNVLTDNIVLDVNVSEKKRQKKC